MRLEEYKTTIKNESDPALLSVWSILAKDARTKSDEVKPHDPNMALILKGLANQYSLYFAHVEKKKIQFEEEAIKAKEAEPIESTPVMEVLEEEVETVVVEETKEKE